MIFSTYVVFKSLCQHLNYIIQLSCNVPPPLKKKKEKKDTPSSELEIHRDFFFKRFKAFQENIDFKDCHPLSIKQELVFQLKRKHHCRRICVQAKDMLLKPGSVYKKNSTLYEWKCGRACMLWCWSDVSGSKRSGIVLIVR